MEEEVVVVVVVVQHSIASPSPPHCLRLPPSTYARSTAASHAILNSCVRAHR